MHEVVSFFHCQIPSYFHFYLCVYVCLVYVSFHTFFSVNFLFIQKCWKFFCPQYLKLITYDMIGFQNDEKCSKIMQKTMSQNSCYILWKNCVLYYFYTFSLFNSVETNTNLGTVGPCNTMHSHCMILTLLDLLHTQVNTQQKFFVGPLRHVITHMRTPCIFISVCSRINLTHCPIKMFFLQYIFFL